MYFGAKIYLQIELENKCQLVLSKRLLIQYILRIPSLVTINEARTLLMISLYKIMLHTLSGVYNIYEIQICVTLAIAFERFLYTLMKASRVCGP